MNKIYTLIIFFCFLVNIGNSQSVSIKYCNNVEFEKTVFKYLDETIPFISCDELDAQYDHYTILDAREFDEYQISHLKNAKHIGYDNPDFSVLENQDKEDPIILYCSIGYRSEKMGEQLAEMGYTNVYNLFGSIFEWINQDKPVYNPKGLEVLEVHTYSKKWGNWVENEDFLKTH